MFVKFPKIGQFRDYIKSAKAHAKRHELDPGQVSLEFHGTVKLHGTNAGVGMNTAGEIWAQSRNRVITPEADNMGFARFVEDHRDDFLKILEPLLNLATAATRGTQAVVLFGEWCGGKIQRNVAISGMPLMFVAFDACYIISPETGPQGDAKGKEEDDDDDDDERNRRWFEPLMVSTAVERTKLHTSGPVYHIWQFEQFHLTVSLDALNEARQTLVDITDRVEKDCPVGRMLRLQEKNRKEAAGGAGDSVRVCTVGEGVVWRGVSGGGNVFRFKVKGDEHCTSRVAPVAGLTPDQLTSVDEFVARTVTENRLRQGLSEIIPESNPGASGSDGEQPNQAWFKSLGRFCQWVVHDIKKEDMDAFPLLADYRGDNGAARKQAYEKMLNKKITAATRQWFLQLMTVGESE